MHEYEYAEYAIQFNTNTEPEPHQQVLDVEVKDSKEDTLTDDGNVPGIVGDGIDAKGGENVVAEGKEESQVSQLQSRSKSFLQKLKTQVLQKISDVSQEVKDQVPKLAMTISELHQTRLVEPTRQWFINKITELKPEVIQLGQKILQRGVQDMKATVKAVASIPKTSRQLFVAFTCIKLLRDFSGSNNLYEGDGYAIFLESAKKVNVVDRLGRSLMKMEIGSFGLPKIEHYQMSLADEANFFTAGIALRDRSLPQKLAKMSTEEKIDALGLLAPHGSSKHLCSFVESDLLSKIEKVLDDSTSSLDIVGGEYNMSRTRDNITIRRTTNSKTSETVFMKVGTVITNNLSPYDVAKIKEAIEPIVSALEQRKSYSFVKNQTENNSTIKKLSSAEMER